MGQNWIIDVLTDLRSFARKNEMPLLAEQLEQTLHVASGEVAVSRDQHPAWPAPSATSQGPMHND